MKNISYIPSWKFNKENNKPAVKQSVLMLTTHGIAEGEWDGLEWTQYRWSCKVKDSDVLYWIHLEDLMRLEKESFFLQEEQLIKPELKEEKIECSPIIKEFISKFFEVGRAYNFGFGPKDFLQEQPELPSDLDEAAFAYEDSSEYPPANQEQDRMVYDAFKAGAELIISELFEKLKITPLKVIGKDEYGYPVYDFEVGHYYRTFTLFGEKYKCDQTDSGEAGEQMMAGQGVSMIITDETEWADVDKFVHSNCDGASVIQIRKKDGSTR